MPGVNDSTGVDGLSRKRARIEDSDTDSRSNDETRGHIAGEAEEIRQRDHEFWYDDGTVILIARNVEFRIYKGLLSDHSSVFRDMFSLPQPSIPQGGKPEGSSKYPIYIPCVTANAFKILWRIISTS